MGGASSLKSVLRVFVLILALTVIWLYLDFSSEDQLLLSDEGTEVAQDETIGNQHDEESMVAEMPEEGLLTLMGSKASDIKKQFGEPERIDPLHFKAMNGGFIRMAIMNIYKSVYGKGK